MNKLLVPAAALVFCVTTFAATAKEQLAERMLESSGAKQQLEETLELTSRNMFSQMAKTTTPEMKAKFERAGKRVGELMKKEMGWETMKPDMIRLYADTYTEEEMKAAIAFYSTPAGKSMATKSGKIAVSGSEIGMKRGAALGPKIQQIVMEEMSGGSSSHPGENAAKPADSFAAIRANAIEKTIINDARQVASAAQQYMAENATRNAPLSEIRKYLSGEKLSTGVKISLFDPKKPDAVKLLDISSKEADALSLKMDGAFVLGHETLASAAQPTNPKLKNNLSTVKGTAAFSVETGSPLTK